MIYLGFDPGKDGGIAALDGNGKYCTWAYTDDNLKLIVLQVMEAMRCGESAAACVEKVGAMPGQGVTSMFSFGHSAGVIKGALMVAEIPFQLIPPRTWKKEFQLDSDKQRSIDVCKRLFPGVDLRRTPKCRKEHDGMAEALLMALYAKRRF